jgi:autotransporter-associated beta strand protein
VATTLTTAGVTNLINILSLPTIAAYPAQFKVIQYAGAIGGAGFNFVLGSLPAGSFCGGYLVNNAAGASVDLVITNCIVPDAFITWDGTISGDWDTKTANWKNNIDTALIYSEGDSVRFDDSAFGLTNINLTETLTPSGITISNNVKSYNFVDLGRLSGSGGLVKQGTGTVVLANEGENDFSGGMTVSGGTLQIGNGGTNGTLPNGPVVNNAALVFNRADDFTVSSAISGSGTVGQNGSGVLRLSGANSFAGQMSVTAGTAKLGHNLALGATNGPTFISAGATLDVDGFNTGGEPIVVSGSGVGGRGAVVNNSGNPAFLNPNVANVTLTGDATFGGTGRWDLRSADTSKTNAFLSTGSHAYNLTKAGTNQVSLVAAGVDAALANIDVQGGIFSVEKVTSSLGNPTNILAVTNGATLQFFQVSNVLSKVVVLKNGATMLNYSGTNTFGGALVLEGSSTFNIVGAWLKLTNVLSGSGSVNKSGNGTLIITAPAVYSGDTVLTSGTLALTDNGSVLNSLNIVVATGARLDVSGRSDGKLTLATGQTLQGSGTISGSLAVNPQSTFAPGPTVGTFTVTNVVTLAGTTVLKLNKSLQTNDVVQGAASIIYGGTLNLTNVAGSLAPGDTFKLFSATNYAGQFGAILPVAPAAGMAWNTNELASNGTISVKASGPSITNIALLGNAVIMQGGGGQSAGTYYVLASTNVALPLTNWLRLATNTFAVDGTFSITNGLEASARQAFYVLQLSP